MPCNANALSWRTNYSTRSASSTSDAKPPSGASPTLSGRREPRSLRSSEWARSLPAIVIGYTGDVCRFPSAGHYAAYNGTAPIEFSSSGRTVHRLSRRGNRTLNHAIHMIAVTQIRNPGSEGRVYYDTKLAAGRTRREAMRSLKRHISDRVYRHLRSDARGR
jgi:transposase